MSTGGKARGGLTRREGFERGLALRNNCLSVSTDIGIKKPKSMPATKSPKKNCSQYRAEVRALRHLTRDLPPNNQPELPRHHQSASTDCI